MEEGGFWGFGVSGSGFKCGKVYNRKFSHLCSTYWWQCVALNDSFRSSLGFTDFPDFFQIIVRSGYDDNDEARSYMT